MTDTLSDDLLRQAINSILHGSTQTVAQTDATENLTYQEVKINDLRLVLVEKLAQKLANTSEFKDLLVKVLAPEFIQKMQAQMLAIVRFNDLPWQIKENFNNQIRDMKLEVKKYKLVAEAVEEGNK